MFPLLHVLNGISMVFCFAAAFRLFRSWRREPYDRNLRNFFLAFLLLGIAFFFIALPGILSDPVVVQLSYTFLYPFAILSAYSLLQVAFEILGNPAWTKWTLLPVIGVIGATLALNFGFFSPAYVRTMGPIFNWSEGTAPWVQMLNTAFLALLTGGDAVLFAWGGIKAKTPFLRLRGFLIAGGLLLLIVGLFLSYTLVFFVPESFQVSVIVLAGVAALLGLVLMLAGVYYKKEQGGFSQQAPQP